MKIANLSNRPVVVRLNTGRTLHLAPRAESEEVHESEVSGNQKLRKLSAHRLIEVQKTEAQKSDAQKTVATTESAAGEYAAAGKPEAEAKAQAESKVDADLKTAKGRK
jgi:hypothetical protein